MADSVCAEKRTRRYFGNGPLKRRCVVCRRKFKVWRGEVARGRGLCCSRECFYRKQRTRRKRQCTVCERSVTVRPYESATKRFCSCRCKAVAQRKVRTAREITQRRLEVRIASLMGYSLKGRKAGCRWEVLVGYTLSDLMAHLEARFVDGMNWSNIGQWHIDHIRPRSAFSYEGPNDPQFLACWALDNLQPLWARDNMSKGARVAA